MLRIRTELLNSAWSLVIENFPDVILMLMDVLKKAQCMMISKKFYLPQLCVHRICCRPVSWEKLKYNVA